MPKINRTRKHTLGLDDAKVLVKKIVEDVKQSYPMLVDDIRWNNDNTSAQVKGKMFEGKFQVTATDISIDIDLSFLAKPFMGKVESRIDTKLEEYFPA